MKTLQKITVLYNKIADPNYAADVDTTKSALEISQVLSEGYEVDLLGITPTTIPEIKRIKTDLVFNLLEWSGKDYIYELEAIKLFQKYNLPFIGSDVFGFELTGNKKIMKYQFAKHDIPTPAWQIFDTGKEKISVPFKSPVIVKPTLEHCGMGITQDSIAKNTLELKVKIKEFIQTFKQPILVEEFISGRELHVTVLEKNGQPWVLPPAEVVFKKEKNYLPILTYSGKWDETSEEYDKSSMQLAELSDAVMTKVIHIATKAYKYLGGRDYPRLDIRLRSNDVYVLEINNNPGIDFSVESGFGLSGRAAGFDYFSMLSHIAKNAYLRFSPAHDTLAI